jgi:hypothetical protein
MPYPSHLKIPQTFLPRVELTRDLTPAQFLDYHYGLCHAISVAETEIQTIMHFRGWCAYGASSGPECVMRKTFPSGHTVATSDKIAPEIEQRVCSILEAQAATPPAPVPAPRRRRRRRAS